MTLRERLALAGAILGAAMLFVLVIVIAMVPYALIGAVLFIVWHFLQRWW